MKANELMKKYGMKPHEENGSYVEKHYFHEHSDRPASGSIYYYIAPGEVTKFHRIDCDEYWCHNAGSDVEIWAFTPDGVLKKHILGTSDKAEPFVYFKKGEIFASRLGKDADDGAFITCITVPRFSYGGFEVIEREEMTALYPESYGFWTDEKEKTDV